MATITPARVTRLSFWAKMIVGMSAFIVFAFAQFTMRGFVDYAHAPLVMHLHAAAMLAWLTLLSAQAVLANRGGLNMHRRLGFAAAVMLPLIVALASITCLTALRAGQFPPFFTPAYFLALVHVGAGMFALLMIGAIVLRSKPAWHRRLTVGSTVLLLEPALGRVLPVPLIMPWGEWVAMAIQLGVVGLMMRQDRTERGHIHPATAAVFAAVTITHLAIELLAVTPSWIAMAEHVAGA